MTNLSDQPAESGTTTASVVGRGPRRWQVGLRALLLLLAVIAVWMTAFVNRRQSERLETRIRVMRPLVRELKIDDTSKVAVVKLEEVFVEDNRWDVYLPSGEYRICVATREISRQGLVASKKSATIKAGKHRLGLELRKIEGRKRIMVTSDGSELLTFEENWDWGFLGNYSGGGEFAVSTQQPRDEPLVLFRRIYMVPNGPTRWVTPKNPADGLLIWIEPVNVPKPSP
jgi:hypothetical protein